MSLLIYIYIFADIYIGRLLTKALSKGSLGSCLVSTDVGSADKHHMHNLQIPVTAESRVPPAWIFGL